MLNLEGETMLDNKKFIEELAKREDLKDIPAITTLRVAIAVLEIVDSGECFLDSKEGKVYVDNV
jgi:hypothetical protein